MISHQTILLLGNYRPTLTLARTFGAAGHRVIVGMEGCDGGAEFSRFTNESWNHPLIGEDEGAFLDALENYVREQRVTLLFPVSEEFVTLFVRHRKRVERLVPIAMVDPDLVRSCLDKISMMERVTRLGIPCAPFAMVRTPRQLREQAQSIGFPLVVRSERSTCRLDGKKALTIESEQELAWLLDIWPMEETGLIIQRQFAGRRYNVYFAAHNGKLIRHVQASILRTDNPDGSGLAVEGLTIEPISGLQDYTEWLAADMNYTGIGCAQYLLNEETGAVSFLEVNARIPGNLNVPEAAGLGLSPILMQLALGEEPDQTFVQGKSGLRYVWVSGEMMAAIVNYLRNEISFVEMLRRGLRAVRSGIGADLHMVFALHDPVPGYLAMARLLPSWSGFVRRVKTKLGLPSDADSSQVEFRS
ncbi:hypothetical protein [Coralliovum pocilloporae]|uniref:ATP-binding protein n=1 Tax=Coralliovum pocilloporae TaxID=3066369 RepID=UPI0033073440